MFAWSHRPDVRSLMPTVALATPTLSVAFPANTMGPSVNDWFVLGVVTVPSGAVVSTGGGPDVVVQIDTRLLPLSAIASSALVGFTPMPRGVVSWPGPVPGVPIAPYDDPQLVSPDFSPHAYIDTAKGTIEVELAILDAPQTARNFMALARKGFFNGLQIHRVVPNFVVQDGDPRGDGQGGPGYTIRDELNQRPYLRGTVGMALSFALIAHGAHQLSERLQQHNRGQLATLRTIARTKGCEPAQVALAWLLAQGDDIVPIPGTKQRKYLEQNVGALEVRLDDDDLARLDRAFPPGVTAGERYPAAQMSRVGL